MLTKIDVIKSAGIPQEDMEYIVKREKVTGQVVTGISAPVLQRLTNQGFTWFVKAEKLLDKFKYHASVDGKREVRDDNYGYPSYSGFIPDFALDRMQAFLQCVGKNIESFVTVHSNFPMPVNYKVVSDPVLIGWLENPKFKYDWDWDDRIFSSKKIDYCKCSDVVGAVIALWDADGKEEVV